MFQKKKNCCLHLKLFCLKIKRHILAYANTRIKSPLEIHCIYLGNKKNYCVFKTCCIISPFYFPKNSIYFIILSLSVQVTLMFFINHALKLKYRPGHLKFKDEDSRVLQNVSIYHSTVLQSHNSKTLNLIRAQHLVLNSYKLTQHISGTRVNTK